jgi:hypothetical protein
MRMFGGRQFNQLSVEEFLFARKLRQGEELLFRKQGGALTVLSYGAAGLDGYRLGRVALRHFR